MSEGTYRFLGHAARTLFTGLLAASTIVFAQDTATPAAPSTNNTTTNNGWKRVDPQSQAQTYNPPADQADSSGPQYDPNAPPPPQYPPQGQYPQAQNPQGQYPPQASSPNGYPPQYPQNGYPPQGQQPGYANAPQPAPPPIPATLVIQPGMYITVRVNQALSSKRNKPGDAFTATLDAPVVVNGVVVAEPGQTLGGRVALAEPSHGGSTGRLGLQLTNLTLVDGQQVPLATQLIGRNGGTTPTGQEVGTVAATTGVGAAIGAAAGWGTGAAIGAGAGAVAGLIGVVLTHGHDSVVYPEQVLTFRIDQPVTISTTTSPQAFHYVEPGEYNQANYASTPYGAPGPYGPGAYGPSYATTAAPPPYYGAGYPYPYYGYGYGYNPYYWGPSFGFYFGPGYWWGGRYYYGRGYWGGRGFYGGGHYSGGAVHGGGGHR